MSALSQPFPDPSEPLVDPGTGLITRTWLDFLRNEQARSGGAVGPTISLGSVGTQITALNSTATGLTTSVAQISGRLDRNALDVKTLGAIGDGVANDTAVIQGAIDALFSAGGGRVFLPIGLYSHTGLTLRHGVEIFGAANVGLNGLGPDFQGSKLVLRPGSNRSSILVPLKQNPAAAYPANVYSTASVGIRNLWIEGNGAAQTGVSHGIEFQASAGVFTPTGTTALGNPVVTSMSSTTGFEIGAPVTGTGIAVGAYVISFTPTTMTLSANCTAAGTVTLSVSDLAVDGHDAASCVEGVYVTGHRNDGVNVPLGWRSLNFNRNLFNSNTGNGCTLLSSDNRFVECQFGNNGGHGVACGSVTNRFVCCDFYVNSGNNVRFVALPFGTGYNTLVACSVDNAGRDGVYNEPGSIANHILGGSVTLSGTTAPGTYANVCDMDTAGTGLAVLGVTFGAIGSSGAVTQNHIFATQSVSVAGCTVVPGTALAFCNDVTKIVLPGPPASLFAADAAGTLGWNGDTSLARVSAGTLGTPGKFRAVGGYALSNTVTATGPVGSIVAKEPVFDASGTALGFRPIYGSIT